MRGQGIIKNLKKYSWAVQPNGNLTIFNVPIFELFGANAHGREPITPEDGQKILKNFQNDKINGNYPRVHLGHHECGSSENRPGAGYMDTLDLRNGVFYADLVEMDSKIFANRANIKYPYRSAEYDRATRRITTLALLESQASFFTLPIMALAEKPVKLNKSQLFVIERRYIEIFQKGEKMPPKDEFEDTEDVETSDPETFDDDEDVSDLPKDENADGSVLDIVKANGDRLDRLISLLEELVSGAEGEDAEESVEPPEEDMAEESEPEDESSVAFQLGELRTAVGSMAKEMYQLKKGKSVNARYTQLERIAEMNPAIDLAVAKDTLEKFQSDSARGIYIKSLAQVPWGGGHSASSYAETFSAQKKNKILEKFSTESAPIRKIAGAAYREYFSILSSPEGEQHKKIWRSPERFVRHVIESEKEQPGYFKKLTS